MAVYVTDTHPLVWYAANKHSKLSRKAKRRFDQASSVEAVIYVPAPVLWEISLLIKAGQINMPQPFDQWVAALMSRPGFDFAPLDLEVITEAHSLSFSGDPFDVAIVATARVMDLSLITTDSNIISAKVVEVEW